MASCVFNLKYLSQNLVKLNIVGGVLKMSGPVDFKSVTGSENQPRFVGVIEQNNIQQTFYHYCISSRVLDVSEKHN